jgi:hypothetical protein
VEEVDTEVDSTPEDMVGMPAEAMWAAVAVAAEVEDIATQPVAKSTLEMYPQF